MNHPYNYSYKLWIPITTLPGHLKKKRLLKPVMGESCSYMTPLKYS